MGGGEGRGEGGGCKNGGSKIACCDLLKNRWVRDQVRDPNSHYNDFLKQITTSVDEPVLYFSRRAALFPFPTHSCPWFPRILHTRHKVH